MGILDRFGIGRAAKLRINSPYSAGTTLPQMIVTDLLSEDQRAQLPMTRDIAIEIPAVSKARNLLTSVIAGFPCAHSPATR
ncbi:hypothetical protein [Leucobacter soli]|uniref:hypothetical protein n=1 Tax=Leucobacter soli TaxID=2812850 RepID=UPI0036150CF1